MKTPVQITFQGLDPSPALEERIRKKAAKLERFADRITSCRVVVERPPAHKHKGGLYHVRIHVDLPGGCVVVGREPGRDHAHEDVGVALRDAFDSAARMLDEHAARQSEAG